MNDRHSGNRLDAPAFHRNHGPILDALTPILAGRQGDALEIGCGSGQHAPVFARAFPALNWWPSDVEPAHRASADAWASEAGLGNLMPAQAIDAAAADWPLGGNGQPPERLAVMHAFNVIHISPWVVAEGIAAGAGRYLTAGGLLIFYGPFKRGGRHTAESNARFDASLRAQDPSWGCAAWKRSKPSPPGTACAYRRSTICRRTT